MAGPPRSRHAGRRAAGRVLPRRRRTGASRHSTRGSSGGRITSPSSRRCAAPRPRRGHPPRPRDEPLPPVLDPQRDERQPGGAYVRYPAADMLGLLAAESRRARAFVIGEDLGLVEPEVRTRLRRRGALSYRLLWFEGPTPEEWPKNAVAAIGTHDLPTRRWHLELHRARPAAAPSAPAGWST